MPRHTRLLLGLAVIAEALLFNGAFAVLASRFDYPDVLRRPATEVLDAFVAGGPGLVLAWYALALSAILMVPLSLGLALSERGQAPLRMAAAILGALAGTVQAVGLVRWVFAVPMLAALPANRETAFLILNQWGGVGIGEHLGYLFTAFFLVTMATAGLAEGRRTVPAVALASAALMVAGSGEGIAIAIGRDGALFGTLAVVGYAGFSLWLAAEGSRHFRSGLRRNGKGAARRPPP